MDVVIPMQQSSDYILLFPQEIDWEKFTQYHPDEPFSDGVIEFLNALSSVLLKDHRSRMFPDVITLAFFCRRANLIALK